MPGISIHATALAYDTLSWKLSHMDSKPQLPHTEKAMGMDQ